VRDLHPRDVDRGGCDERGRNETQQATRARPEQGREHERADDRGDPRLHEQCTHRSGRDHGADDRATAARERRRPHHAAQLRRLRSHGSDRTPAAVACERRDDDCETADQCEQ